jgi:hypothetical protein
MTHLNTHWPALAFFKGRTTNRTEPNIRASHRDPPARAILTHEGTGPGGCCVFVGYARSIDEDH